MNDRTSTVSIGRLTIAGGLAALAAMLSAVTVSAFGAHSALSIAAGLAVAAAVALATMKRLSTQWDGVMRRHPLLSALWLLLLLAALARTAGLALFMADPANTATSAYWFDEFYVRHSCFSGYWQAAKLAGEGAANLYDGAHYAGFVGIFKIDEFLYLPQFVILPMLGTEAGASFESIRAAWFGLEGATVLIGLLMVANRVGGDVGRRIALLAPAVWIGTPTLLTLQLGNFQLASIALSVIAMLLFERGRNALGGALFSLALFKLFPGILGIYLIVTKRWRAVAWTFAFSALYAAAAYAWAGPEPFRAFLEYNLPRMSSGEAWAFLEIKELAPVVAINDSVPGIAQKLGLLGVGGMDRALVQTLSWVWTALVVVMTILAALRASRQSAIEQAAVWLALLALASFRSPFLPDHSGLFAPLWLWSLIAAAHTRGFGRGALFALMWVALTAVLPFMATGLSSGMDRLAISGVSQAVAIAICLWAVLRRPAQMGADSASSSLRPAMA